MKKTVLVIVAGMAIFGSISCMQNEKKLIKEIDIKNLNKLITEAGFSDHIKPIMENLASIGGALLNVEKELININDKALIYSNNKKDNRARLNLKSSIKNMADKAKGLHPNTLNKQEEMEFLNENNIKIN